MDGYDCISLSSEASAPESPEPKTDCNVPLTYPTVSDSNIEAIINKYKNYPSCSSSVSVQNDSSTKDILEQLKAKYANETTGAEEYEKFSDEETISPIALTEGSGITSKRRKIDTTKEEEKLLNKLQKQQERERKKQAAEKDKALKRALAEANKNLKPEESLNFITVFIDAEIINSPFGSEVLVNLQNGINYKIQSQIIPYSVTWNRQVQTHLVKDDGQLVIHSDTCEVGELLLLMDCAEFINLVHCDSLLSHVKSVKSIFDDTKKVFLGVYGLESYYKYQNNQKKAEVGNEKTKSTKDKQLKNLPKVGRRSIEFALTQLQICCDCCHRLLEKPEDVGLIITQFTKAIAQAPYKAEKNLKHQQSEWYMAGENKDCVKVDKDGNGLQRLWHQQLTTFPLARLETAEAIASQYSTPKLLMEAYEQCDLQSGQELLQDIPIRRAAGALTTVRRIGPELSKKVYNFFTAIDGDTNIANF